MRPELGARGGGGQTPMNPTLCIDLYQVTTLVAHAAAGRLGQQVGMSFFFRKMPPSRNYVVVAGTRDILEEHAPRMGLRPEEVEALMGVEVLRPVSQTPAGRQVAAALGALQGFCGDIDAVAEGTLAFAGEALDIRGQPALVAGKRFVAYTPMIQVRTDMVRAKLVETPWLSRLNYMSMVASKAARVAWAARSGGAERPVMEFGQRRTHPEAAASAAYAAYLGGCSGTSNVAAGLRYGIPLLGTMDHFAVQASEVEGVPVRGTELSMFRQFRELFPHAATLLVDTYSTGRGIGNAVGAGATGIRIDSNVTPETIHDARQLLRELGAGHVKIFASDGLDEYKVEELAQAGVDGFGVGENITCSPDSATGVGAVGKLVLNGYGKLTMKLAKGSSKATLPGMLQCYRFADHDLLAMADEPKPKGGRALLEPAWRGTSRVGSLPSPSASRDWVRSQISELPESLQRLEKAEQGWPILVSDALLETVRKLQAEAM